VRGLMAERPDPPPAFQELQALAARAKEGHLEVLPQLREFLDNHPEIWEQCGDVARHALDSWFDLIAGPDLVAKESLARKAVVIEAEVAGPMPSPLERLLAKRVVACWLQVSHADAMVAQAGNVSVRVADFARRRQDSAHRRLVTAIGALATVRKLLPAAVEIRALTAPAAVPQSDERSPGSATATDLAGSESAVPDGENDGLARPDLLLSFVPSGEVAGRGVNPSRAGKPQISQSL
jgi:hypothetical protein